MYKQRVSSVLDTFKFNTKYVRIGHKEIILPSVGIISGRREPPKRRRGIN